MASRTVTDNEYPGPSLGLGSNLEIFLPSPSRPRPARTVPVLGLSFSTRLLVPVVGFGIRWQLPPYRILSYPSMADSSVQVELPFCMSRPEVRMRDVSLLFGADMNHRAAHSRGRRLTCIACLNQSSINLIDETIGGWCFGNRLRRKGWWRIRLTAPCFRAWLTSVAYKMTAASAVDRPCWRCGPDDPVARRRASSGPAPFWTAL